MPDHYDVSLTEWREDMLLKNQSYKSIHEKDETHNIVMENFNLKRPKVVIY